MEICAFDLAQRFVGVREVAGPVSNAHILAMLRLDTTWVCDDEIPWCSAFVNYVAWLLRLPRSKNLAARSWLTVGTPISLEQARPLNDVVILSRGADQRGAEVLDAPGHVGFFAGLERARAGVLLLGGNQGDGVTVAIYPASRVIGVRRLA